MRYIAFILVFYVSVMNVTPAICGSYTYLVQTNVCRSENNGACSDDKSQQNPKSASPCLPCCYVQNCHCNIVTIPEFNFQVFSDLNIEKIPTENDKIYFNYLSDCWHPPKS